MRSTINLYEGDCRPAMRKMADNQYDLAIVDVPYGIGLLAQKFTKPSRPNSYKGLPKHNVFNDTERPTEKYFKELFRISNNQIIWGATNLYDLLPLNDSWIFWNKMNGEGSHFADGEFAFTSFSCSSKLISISQHHGTKGGKDRIHPTQKPVRLYKWLLKNYAKPGDNILDTHGGSMSIAIACWDAGHDLDLYEIDRDYFEAGKKRLENHQAQLRLY